MGRTHHEDLSTAAKKEFKSALYTARDEVPVGTLYRLRQNTGINFKDDSSLKKSIHSFAFENSSEIPDLKGAKNNLRFYNSYKNVLWTQYKSLHSSDISYSHFCSLWPSNVIKPKIEDYGTCKCIACENPELLLSGMKRAKVLSHIHDLDLSLIHI